jgi:ABC-type uncharacterized transport system auxiliary subunit
VKIAHLILTLTLSVMLYACAASGRPIKYYRIEVPTAAAPSPATGVFGVTLHIANIEAPAIMRDGRILYEVGANEVGTYEYHRWVETPDRMVQNALIRMLRSSGKYQSIDRFMTGAKSDYIVRGKIYEFAEIDKPEIYTRVSIEIELHETPSNRTVWSHVYSGEEKVDGKEMPNVVQSFDSNLNRRLSEIVAGIDEYFAGRRRASGTIER